MIDTIIRCYEDDLNFVLDLVKKNGGVIESIVKDDIIDENDRTPIYSITIPLDSCNKELVDLIIGEN